FTGVIRDHDGGRGVSELRYEAHPTAQRVLTNLAERLATSGGVLALAVAHRVGALHIGDIALLCTVAAAHRGQAFDTCERLIDDIKAQLPIWKQQRFTEGSTEWVGL
ncbi:MAG: molybdenum cofactor biosynthesis protein MoaE, partial [Mycobacteriales bacterium]